MLRLCFQRDCGGLLRKSQVKQSSVDYGYAVSNFSWNTSKETLTSLLSWENIDLRSMH
jgi:hypothetical protein